MGVKDCGSDLEEIDDIEKKKDNKEWHFLTASWQMYTTPRRISLWNLHPNWTYKACHSNITIQTQFLVEVNIMYELVNCYVCEFFLL